MVRYYKTMNIDKELLHRYFNRQCTDLEQQAVEDYLAGEDTRVFDAYFASFARAATTVDGTSVTAKEEKKKLFRRAGASVPQSRKLSYAAAAVFLLAAACGYLYSVLSKPVMSHVAAETWVQLSNPSSTSVHRVKLEDGSIVFLNSHASLCYDRSVFNKKKRELSLDGEAYFEVAHDPTRPFIIRNRDIVTTVKGTKFNVEAYGTEEEMHVTLMEGKVVVQQHDWSYTMRPNERVSIDRRRNKQVEPVRAAFFNRWIENGEIAFDNVPLKTALERIGILYNISIAADNKLLDDKYVQGVFKRQSVADVLEKVLFIHGLHYKKEARQYTITH
ncbi:FecR family protein [Niabella beijingensis]|uniref:FecR family protein n=1 Tax=Niabella beijingensis TaxID=2872700 RepID=UPI001CC02357|nr:FecR domain-containing protein [Niabella beijingensis]MBZ4188008.1 FecR domain-containing protein [Niabella beijingensis]